MKELAKRHSDKDAISPIIATLLLILIAIAAGVIVYAYVIGFVGNSTNNNGQSTNTLSVDQLSLASKVSSVPVTVFVRNLGPGTELFNNGFYLKGTTTNMQLSPAVSMTLASGAISVTNVALTATGTNSIVVTLTCSGTGTATVSVLGASATTSACSGSSTATVSLPSGVVCSSNLASANTAFASVALSATAVVVGVALTAGTISMPTNAVLQLTLAPQGQIVASGAGAGQANEPLSAGQTYSVSITGTDGSSIVASARSF